MRFRRAAALAVLAVPAAVALAWLGVFAAVVVAANRDGAERLDEPAAAIIVLGAAQYNGRPSPVLRARLDHGIALWHAGRAPRLIVTGGGRDGDRTTEAAVGRRYAVGRGVPDSVILMESEGRTTSESIRAASALLHEVERQEAARAEAARRRRSGLAGVSRLAARIANGIRGRDTARQDAARDNAPAGASDGASDGASEDVSDGAPAYARGSTAILVSDPFHMLRLAILARRYGITPVTSPTPTSPISASPRVAWEYMLRESVKVPFAYFMEKSDE